MRERKYKFWDKHNKVWAGPYTLKQLADYDQFSFDREYHPICSKWECFECVEYIGHKDKKGEEIYEGDILQDIFEHRKVAFHCIDTNYAVSGFSFRDVKDNDLVAGFSATHRSWLTVAEIIGNIYEHGHLLEIEGGNDA